MTNLSLDHGLAKRHRIIGIWRIVGSPFGSKLTQTLISYSKDARGSQRRIIWQGTWMRRSRSKAELVGRVMPPGSLHHLERREKARKFEGFGLLPPRRPTVL